MKKPSTEGRERGGWVTFNVDGERRKKESATGGCFTVPLKR